MKYGVISCEDAVKWGGEQGSGELVRDVFKIDDDDEWSVITAITGPLPSIEELATYDGFIVTGSHYSAASNDPWVLDLMNMLQTIVDMNRSKLVGLCFGHQAINRALGGEVSKNASKKFVFKTEQISINCEISNLISELMKEHDLGTEESITLFESHGDEVSTLPIGANLIASSDSCTNEIICYGDRVLTMQSHPELTREQMEQKILPALTEQKLLSDEDVMETLESFELKRHDAKMICLIRRFIGMNV